ncbi:MAG: hypothetical protein AAGJ97_01275 [Planctomycetota bacterium]
MDISHTVAAVTEPDRVDNRLACLKALFGTTIGVGEGGYEWCPDDDPPTADETLAWQWFTRPDLDGMLRPTASPRLAGLMTAYREGRLEDWWRRLVDDLENGG